MTDQQPIVFLVFQGVNALDVAGPAEAFAAARREDGAPAYAIETWSIDAEAVRAESGLRLAADRLAHGRLAFDRLDGDNLADDAPSVRAASTLVVPGGAGVRRPETLAALADWLRAHRRDFDRVASVCTGAYALAEAGLLDGRAVTTHWAHADDLQRRYPEVRVRADALHLEDGRVYSSGGVTAGIDLALDLIERDLGPRAAMRAARELVVFLRRPGGQAQYSLPLQMQTAASDALGDVCAWAANNLDADLSVEALAARAGLSARQFARRFTDALGAPPAAYVKRLRLDAGRSLLTQGVSVAQAAHAVGFASVDGFRRAFEGQFGVTPADYRRRFGLELEGC